MVQIHYHDIPVNFAQQVKEVEQVEVFLSALDFVKNHTDSKEITISFQGQSNGAILVDAASNDLWLYRSPTGNWAQAYIGYDEKYCLTALPEDQYTLVFTARIHAFQKTLPVYIKKQFS